MNRVTLTVLIAALTCPLLADAAAVANPFDAPIQKDRPRVFLRRDNFEGLTIAKLRHAMTNPEYAGLREKLTHKPPGRAILWMLDGRDEDLAAAIAGLKKMDAAGGTWSDRGQALIELAMLFDWLYDRLDDPTRRQVIVKIEKAADAAMAHIKGGQAPYFYTRTPGALAGMTVAGIALMGVSDKAEGYLKLFREWGVNDYFKTYEWVDGAATGGLYSIFYTYVDLPALCAAWWSATGQNPAEWIKQNQGDWLGKMVAFNLWYMRPGFAFTDINDTYRDIWGSHDQFCQGLDIASYVTRDGYGRAWAQRWLGKHGAALYHTEYADRFIFRDVTLQPKPLTDLPLAQLFGRESCGYGFFRSAWPGDNQPDTATHVFFRCGDPMDVHGGVSAGEFQIFKYAPLAARSGKYSSYDSPPDQYHRNCISTNVVLFLDPDKPDDRGDQNTRRGLKDDHKTWNQWLEIRKRNGLDVATVLDWQVNKGEARCRADLSATNPKEKCSKWIREFVWLGNKHLVVLDIVETARPQIRRLWQLHSLSEPTIGNRTVTIANRPPNRKWAIPELQPKSEEGKLYCQTLLPEKYTVVLHSGGQARTFDPTGQRGGNVEGNPYHSKYAQNVIQIDPGNQENRTVFLHVLTALDAAERQGGQATCRLLKSGQLEVTVDGSSTVLSVPDWVLPPR